MSGVLSYASIHRVWASTRTTSNGAARSGDAHYIAFAREVGDGVEREVLASVRRSLLASSERFASALSVVEVERLLDDALSHDARVLAARRETESDGLAVSATFVYRPVRPFPVVLSSLSDFREMFGDCSQYRLMKAGREKLEAVFAQARLSSHFAMLDGAEGER